ncbi:MAG: DUF3857 domain-containing protein, partial [Chitinophagales bacterium]|nr:DUF3857 domain-containing protein [Chitinophagales bacterium]
MKKFVFITLIAITGPTLHAQTLMYEDYDWELSPNLHTLTEQEMKEPEILLKDKTAIEYAYDKEGTLQAYFLTHKIIRVHTNEAIEDNNKIYLPYSDNSEIIRQKVRVITSTGKVIKLGTGDIKEAKDEETESVYRYFALEGIDLGSEI